MLHNALTHRLNSDHPCEGHVPSHELVGHHASVVSLVVLTHHMNNQLIIFNPTISLPVWVKVTVLLNKKKKLHKLRSNVHIHSFYIISMEGAYYMYIIWLCASYPPSCIGFLHYYSQYSVKQHTSLCFHWLWVILIIELTEYNFPQTHICDATNNNY